MTRGDHRRQREADCREAADLIRRIAGHVPGEHVADAIRRACKVLGWSFSRCENIWHGEARRIDNFEMDLLRAVAGNQASGPVENPGKDKPNR